MGRTRSFVRSFELKQPAFTESGVLYFITRWAYTHWIDFPSNDDDHEIRTGFEKRRKRRLEEREREREYFWRTQISFIHPSCRSLSSSVRSLPVFSSSFSLFVHSLSPPLSLPPLPLISSFLTFLFSFVSFSSFSSKSTLNPTTNSFVICRDK